MAIYFDKKYIIPDIDIDVVNNKLMLLENNLLKKSWTNFLANLYTFDKNYYNYTVQLDYFGKLFFLNSQLLIIKDFSSVLNLSCFKNNITINKLINSYKNKIIKHQHYLKR
jgi:hypothetical protein